MDRGTASKHIRRILQRNALNHIERESFQEHGAKETNE
jgi:hypothetical protein